MLEFGINKHQLVKKEQPGAAQPVQEERTMYESALEQMEERTQTLQESKFKLGGVTYRDGKEMALVKEYQKQIASAMREAVPKDGEQLEISIKMFEDAYHGLIAACESYVATHKKPRTAAGKARLRLVSKTMNLAQGEIAKFRKTAIELQKVAVRENQDYVWGNVLGSIRGAEFDLDKMQDIQAGGAATSELKILHTGRETFFFKEEEVLTSAEEEFKKHYSDVDADEQNQAIYTEIRRLIRTQDFDRVFDGDPGLSVVLKKARTQSEREQEEACRQVIKDLRLVGARTTLNWEDKRTRDILIETLPRVNVWMTRELASKGAQIDKGESLSKRNVLTSRMAILLGVPEVVAHSNMTTLYQGGEQKEKGVAMAKAKGMQHTELDDYAYREDKNLVYSAEAIRQFSALRLMDTICGQIDRHMGNRFVTFVEEENRIIITGVQGIDHDLSFGDMKYNDLKRRRSNLPAFEKQNGACSFAALDKELVEALRSLTRESLEYYLGDLLGEKYLDAMWDRCQGVVAKINETEQEHPEFLVEKNQWNVEVAKKYEVKDEEDSGYIWVQPGEVVANPVQQNGNP